MRRPAAPPAGYVRFRAGNAEVVALEPYHEGAIAALADSRSDGTLHGFAATQPTARGLRGRGVAYAVALPGAPARVVVRRSRHGGWLAPLTGERFLAPTRAPRELATSIRLRRARVPTPEIVGYALYPAGPLLRRADVVSREVPDARDLAEILTSANAGADERAAALAATGRLLLALAEAGARHPDLNLKNVLLARAEAGGFDAYVLDVDRVVFEAPGGAVAEANLRRFSRSARKLRDRDAGAIGEAELRDLAAFRPRKAHNSSRRVGQASAAGGRSRGGERIASADGRPPAVAGTPLDRVCIVMLSAVGDAVHVLPVINALVRHQPSTRITWVIQPVPAELVRGHPAVHDIVICDRPRGWRAFLETRRELATRRFDVLFALNTYLKANICTAFARAPVKLGFDWARSRDMNWLFTNRKVPPHPVQHVQDQYFEFLKALGVPTEPVVWNLGPWAEERERQRAFFEGFDRPAAAIVVATSRPLKDWFPERWAEVVDVLYEDFGLQPVLVGGRSSRELATEREILARVRSPVVSALGSGLRQLVGILDGCALVISPDTGPLHMAVALGRPVVGLFGHTNPKRVGPYRRFHDLIVDTYGDPGEVYPPSMQSRGTRMTRIQVRDVLDKVDVWRRRYFDVPAEPRERQAR